MITKKTLCWSDKCATAVSECKKAFTSDTLLLLLHYNPKITLLLATDASPVGIGYVISHVMSDGSERPIAFASRRLTKAERDLPTNRARSIGNHPRCKAIPQISIWSGLYPNYGQ